MVNPRKCFQTFCESRPFIQRFKKLPPQQPPLRYIHEGAYRAHYVQIESTAFGTQTREISSRLILRLTLKLDVESQ